MRAHAVALTFAALICCATARAADRDAEPIVSRIKRAPVESNAIAAIGYSKRLHALELEFRNGFIYRYEDVPPAVYDELLSAASKARYYDQNVRGKYHRVRVKPRDDQ